MKSIIEIKNLSVAYNGGLALEDISFSIVPGERVAVVGPNGAGKSTLFKAVAGLLRPRSGEILHGHIEIGYVTQRSSVDWDFPVTVFDVVLMGRVGKMGWLRWQRSSDREIAHRSLEQVGMLEHADHQIGELSGGQQQRIFIARALAQEAELMLMDEPFSGVDLPSQEAIMGILDRLHEQGITVMVSTHDINMAVERFDKIALLNRRLVVYGQPQEVMSPQKLVDAYGGNALLRGEDYAMLLGDIDCCGEREHQHD
jgi:manganese/iron transport system ATP-binding protein